MSSTKSFNDGSCQEECNETRPSCSNDKNGPATPSIKSRASKREQRKSPSEYRESIQRKDQRSSKLRAEGLKGKAEDLLKFPDVQLYLKIQVQSPRSNNTFEVGKYFMFKEEAKHQIIIRSDVLCQQIEANIAAGMQKILDEIRFKETTKSAVSSSSPACLSSPTKKRVSSKQVGDCKRCKKNEIIKGEYTVDTEWITCSFADKKVYCSGSVHADCLGFPGATEDQIHQMPSWFCKVHISDGRRQLNVSATKKSGKTKLYKDLKH